MFRSGIYKLRFLISLTGFAFACTGTTVCAQLRTALEIRSLTADEVEEGRPVDITGVVIFSDPPATVFLQDETAGAFYRLEGKIAPDPGDLLRVRGVTFPGLFVPGIERASVEKLDNVGLPEPTDLGYDELLSGRYHYQRVRIEGIVRSIGPDEEGASILRLATGSRVIEILVEMPESEAPLLVDAKVSVTGLAAGRINDRRQLIEPYLRCASWENISLIRPAKKAEDAPLVTPGKLMTFDVSGRAGNRVRLIGEALGVIGRAELFLRQGDAAVAVRLIDRNPGIQPGDTVEVAGFPDMDRFSAALSDAKVIAVTRHPDRDPEPAPTSLSDLLQGTHDNNLVQLQGTVIDWYRSATGYSMVLRDDLGTVTVRTRELPDQLDKGTLARVTGLCRVENTREAQYRAHPSSVSLWMRGPDDFEVVSVAPWWTPARLGTALVVLLMAVLLAGLWIALLQRQVARQTTALKNQIEKDAILEERQRIAREFHDTLEQGLAGLSLRLDAASSRDTDEKSKKFLSDARNLVTHIQTEARDLLFDLRQPGDSGPDLEAAMLALYEDSAPDRNPFISVELDGVPALPSRVTHHLKMMLREGVTNALKHACASTIRIGMQRQADRLIFSVVDDGNGIENMKVTEGTPGHFGCMGIRERARKIGAEIEWLSSDGGGTVLQIRLPFPNE